MTIFLHNYSLCQYQVSLPSLSSYKNIFITSYYINIAIVPYVHHNVENSETHLQRFSLEISNAYLSRVRKTIILHYRKVDETGVSWVGLQTPNQILNRGEIKFTGNPFPPPIVKKNHTTIVLLKKVTKTKFTLLSCAFFGKKINESILCLKV